MSETIQHTFLRRLRHTPLRDLLRIRITGRLDYRRLIEQSELPAPVTDLILRVVRRTRLWALERVDVAIELIAHFHDGLDAGGSIEELIQSFGDEVIAARLIRRAKIRNRSWFWHAIHWLYYGFVCLAVIYAALFLQFIVGQPSSKVDYLAAINAASTGLPEDQRAWPLYREAILGYDIPTDPKQAEDWYRMLDTRPGFKLWPQMSQWLDGHQKTLELIRQASQKPVLGFIFGANGSANDPQLFPKPGFKPPFWNPFADERLLWNSIQPGGIAAAANHLARAMTIVVADAELARQHRQSERWLSDVVALLRIASQVRDGVMVTTDIAGIRIRNAALDQIDRALTDPQFALDDVQLQSLAHLLARPQNADELISFTGTRTLFYDFVQHLYTDDGHGDGQMTPAGLRAINTGGSGPLFAAMAPIMASRKSLVQLFDGYMDMAEANLHKPMRDANWSSYESAIVNWRESMVSAIRYFPVAIMIPSLHNAHMSAEQSLGQRDGILVGIALESYRRKNSRYPDSLDALVPQILPSIPADRITGQPVHYRLIDGKPVVYSVGADRDDDGGRAPVDKNGRFENYRAANWDPPNDNTVDGDWVLYPQPHSRNWADE